MVRFPENLVRNRPIIIENYNPNWPLLYEKEKRDILTKLGSSALGIEHIGSTSVPGSAAKPIIDIMVRITNLTHARECIPLIESLDYRFSPEVEHVFSEIRDNLTSSTQRAYDDAKTYHDGKWLYLSINNEEVVKDIKQLLNVRRKPKKINIA